MRIEIVIADDVRWDLRETLVRAGCEVVACGSGFRVRIGAVVLGPAQARVSIVAERIAKGCPPATADAGATQERPDR